MLDIGATGTGGSFKSLKFNAKDALWTHRGINGEETIDPPQCLFDFKNIQTGYMLFKAGEIPIRTFDPELGVRAQKVHPDQKRGFCVNVYSTKFPEQGVAEFCSTSVILGNAVNDLYAEYTKGVEANPGMLPVVKAGANTVVKGKYGTNYAPSFEITGWAERPADLPDALPAPEDIGVAVAGLTNGAAAPHVAPPPTPQPASTEAASAAEF